MADISQALNVNCIDIVIEHATLTNVIMESLTEIWKRYFRVQVALVKISFSLCLGLNSAILNSSFTVIMSIKLTLSQNFSPFSSSSWLKVRLTWGNFV